MPEVAAEPPDPAEQEGDQEGAQHEPAGQRGHIGRGLVEPEGGEHHGVRLGQLGAATHEDLALEIRFRHRRHRGGLPIPFLLGPLLAERTVRNHERRDEIGGEPALRLGQVAGHLLGQARPDDRDLRVPELGPLRAVEHAGGLGPDGDPAGSLHRPHEISGRGGQVPGHPVEDQLALDVGGRRVEGRVEQADGTDEGRGLCRSDGDGPFAREVVLGRNGVGSGLARGRGQRGALVGPGPGGNDVRRYQVTDLDIDPRRREVSAEDHGHRHDQADGCHGQSPGFAPGQSNCGVASMGEHVSPLRRQWSQARGPHRRAARGRRTPARWRPCR